MSVDTSAIVALWGKEAAGKRFPKKADDLAGCRLKGIVLLL